MRDVRCRHCGQVVAVAECNTCGRGFAITTGHREGRPRGFDDAPMTTSDVDFDLTTCDFCASRAAGDRPDLTIRAGMAQATCPSCHTEFLS